MVLSGLKYRRVRGTTHVRRRCQCGVRPMRAIPGPTLVFERPAEFLAVGTPVVTYPGRFLRGRISDALYHRMGMRALVAADSDQYVKLAVRLATDPDFGHNIRLQIAETNPTLYDNQEDITAREDFFQSLATDNWQLTTDN